MNGIDKTFCLFLDIVRTLDRMSDADAGVLFKALAAHANGQEVDLTRSEKADLVYPMIADQMDRLKEYRQKKSRRKQEQTGANESKQTQTATPYPYPYPYQSSPIGEEREEPPKQERKAPKRFVPPTVEEVAAYVAEKKLHVDPERFVAFYTSKNWFVGKNKMANWKAAVSGWSSRDKPVEIKPGREKIDYSAITRDLFVSELKGETG